MTEVIHFLTQPFSDFNFMQRALWGCLLLSISGTPIGVFFNLASNELNR